MLNFAKLSLLLLVVSILSIYSSFYLLSVCVKIGVALEQCDAKKAKTKCEFKKILRVTITNNSVEAIWNKNGRLAIIKCCGKTRCFDVSLKPHRTTNATTSAKSTAKFTQVRVAKSS